MPYAYTWPHLWCLICRGQVLKRKTSVETKSRHSPTLISSRHSLYRRPLSGPTNGLIDGESYSQLSALWKKGCHIDPSAVRGDGWLTRGEREDWKMRPAPHLFTKSPTWDIFCEWLPGRERRGGEGSVEGVGLGCLWQRKSFLSTRRTVHTQVGGGGGGKTPPKLN